MARTRDCRHGFIVLLLSLAAVPAMGQSFRVQCPTSTITHPASIGSTVLNNSAEPAYTAPTTFTTATAGPAGSSNHGGYLVPSANVNGAIKCQQISGGDGYASMADGTQTYMFSFGPLSGIGAIATGQPGTQFPSVFNTPYGASAIPLAPGDPATRVVGAADGAIPPGGSVPPLTTAQYTQAATFYNGAIGLVPDLDNSNAIDGHVDPRQIMDVGVMNGNIPAPLMAIDEDDEFFLTLTNVGMIMRPDLFEQHTVHFHGYPNASSLYDGVPDASVAINIGASFTYYYLAPDAGTYFWHCHITPPEHLQMGMVGQLYVRPRQNRVPAGTNLYYAMTGTNTGGTFGTATGPSQQSDLRTACNSNGQSELFNGSTTPSADILCSIPSPAANNGTTHATGYKYVYNDGDGSTRYEVDVPMQMHGFDPNFHFVGMTFNPEGFADMKDKYFLLNGRSYPDTVGMPAGSVAGWSGGVPTGATNPDPVTKAILTQGSDGQSRPEQPISTLVTLSQTAAPDGGPQIAALRLVNLSVSEYHTLASLSIPLHVIGWNAKMLRDQAGNNMDYYANSITIGGGESMDALLDACAVRGPAPAYKCTKPVPVGTYFLYTPNLDHLSNDAENFGGLMTEVVVTP